MLRTSINFHGKIFTDIKIMRKHLIISGHQGYIGSYFCDFLRRKGIKFSKFYFNKSQKNMYKFTHFFHFDFEIKMKKDSLSKNKFRILKILDICSRNKIKLIFPSTCTYRYNKLNKRISKKIFPINKYSRSKIQCEDKILECSKKKDLDYFIFRIFNVYGNNINNRWVVASLIKKLIKNKIIKLKYPENIRDFIHIEDLSKLFIKCINKNKSGIFEVGSGNAISIRNLALELRKILKVDSKIIDSKPFKSKINNFSKSNINLTKVSFSWKPRIKLKEGLKNIRF